mmetsp:Transcript_36582/g.59879  ORF Transcript_36582/g.59879 Transcript_36582/m.59879 type:complete len:90 (-) Transcript_36582:539-808(-)
MHSQLMRSKRALLLELRGRVEFCALFTQVFRCFPAFALVADARPLRLFFFAPFPPSAFFLSFFNFKGSPPSSAQLRPPFSSPELLAPLW